MTTKLVKRSCREFSEVLSYSSNLRLASMQDQDQSSVLAKVFGLKRKCNWQKNAVNHSDVRETLASLPLPSYVAKLGRRLFGRRSLFLSLSLSLYSASQWIPVAFQITEM